MNERDSLLLEKRLSGIETALVFLIAEVDIPDDKKRELASAISPFAVQQMDMVLSA